MKRAIILIALCMVCAGIDVSAQTRSEKPKPQWLKSTPKPSNNTFNYVVKYDMAASLEDARQKCLTDLVMESGFENGMVVVSNINTDISDQMVWEGDNLVNRTSESFDANTQIQGKETALAVKKITEYWERKNGEYHLYSLYARSNLGQTARFDEVRLTKQYGAHGLWRSALLPGWGQMHKGSTAKGITLLGGTAAAAVGIVLTENMRSSYYSLFNREYGLGNEAKAKLYLNKADNLEIYRNICIGAAAAIYVYNIVDAIVAPGATRIVPILTNNGGAGLSYSTTF